MASNALRDSGISLMSAIDGSHLQWSDFRSVVLSAFRIVLLDSIQISDLNRGVAEVLSPSLQDLNRFIDQRAAWRDQLGNGRGFGSTMVFPPNLLPSGQGRQLLQRCLAPKLSREALPPRTVVKQPNVFELPAPKPNLLTGFIVGAFNEAELSILPNCTASTGTVVDFEKGIVSPGTTVHCPFLVFERMNTMSEETIQAAKNKCAIAGAHCIRAIQLLFKRAHAQRGFEKPVSFTCALDNATALINYHFVDSENRYCMTEISRFDLEDDDAYLEFQAWIDAIEDWGVSFLLPTIKRAIRQLLASNSTPPISPMPSLTLSIDTARGSEEVLMKILRTTFDSIKWKCEGEYDTPINSSLAQCGTPLPARRMRATTMSPISPNQLHTPSAPVTPFSTWRMRPDYGVRSPSLRAHPVSPLVFKQPQPYPDSPVRRLTLSPCTPPPEAPNSSKAPMLVLQRRMDLAMDEISELKVLVQTLTGELKKKDRQLDAKRDAMMKAQWGLEKTEACMGPKAGFWNSTFDHAPLWQKWTEWTRQIESKARQSQLPLGYHFESVDAMPLLSAVLLILVLSLALEHSFVEVLLLLGPTALQHDIVECAVNATSALELASSGQEWSSQLPIPGSWHMETN